MDRPIWPDPCDVIVTAAAVLAVCIVCIIKWGMT